MGDFEDEFYNVRTALKIAYIVYVCKALNESMKFDKVVSFHVKQINMKFVTNTTTKLEFLNFFFLKVSLTASRFRWKILSQSSSKYNYKNIYTVFT